MLSHDFINKNIITQISNDDIIINVKNFYEKEYLSNYKNIYENLINVSIENAILNKKNISKYINFNRLNEIYVKNIKDFIKPTENYACIKKHICYDFIKKYVINCHENGNNYDNTTNILYIHVYGIDEKLKKYEIKSDFLQLILYLSLRLFINLVELNSVPSLTDFENSSLTIIKSSISGISIL